jgi:hypothetical protein
VEEEFKDLVDENWDWQVRELGDADFAMIVPSKESLRMACRGGGLTLTTSKSQAFVAMSLGDPMASEHLQEIWVKMFCVPPALRHANRLLLSTREVGRPIAVDVDSFSLPDGPVGMSFGCRAPVQLLEYITLFVNMEGFKIKLVPEADLPTNSPPRANNNHPPFDKGNDDKDDDYDETNEDRWDGRRSTTTLETVRPRLPQLGTRVVRPVSPLPSPLLPQSRRPLP